MLIAFDTDGCLIDADGNEKPEVVALLKSLAKDNFVIVWSGNGIKHVAETVKRLKLEGYVNGMMDKTDDFKPDLTIDDKKMSLGKLNLQII